MNRRELQSLTDNRVEDAQALLAASRWSAAYYLVGYAVECALKSCVLAHVERSGIIFVDKKFGANCWTHDLEALVKQADLLTERGLAIQANAQLGANWLVAKTWSEADRYRSATQQHAEVMFDAIANNSDGVLQWIKNHW